MRSEADTCALEQVGDLPSLFVHSLMPSFLIPSIVSGSFMSGTVLPDVHNSHFPRRDKEEHPFFSVVRLSQVLVRLATLTGQCTESPVQAGIGTDL